MRGNRRDCAQGPLSQRATYRPRTRWNRVLRNPRGAVGHCGGAQRGRMLRDRQYFAVRTQGPDLHTGSFPTPKKER